MFSDKQISTIAFAIALVVCCGGAVALMIMGKDGWRFLLVLAAFIVSAGS